MNQIADAKFEGFRRLCEESVRAPGPRLERKRPVWIFGAGHFGRDLCAVLRDAGFSVLGFIETSPGVVEALGLPVRTWSDFAPGPIDDQLAVGIFNHLAPFNALEGLARAAGFRDVFLPWDLYTQFEAALGWRFWLSGPGAIAGKLPEIERAYRCFADDASRACFLRVLAFRLGRDTEFGSFTHTGLQYFNEITMSALPATLRYVDGGAFNGDTYLELARRCTVAEAYLFEPDPLNFRELSANVGEDSAGVVCFPMGLSDAYRILSFSAEGRESSAVLEEGRGSAHIAAVDLDCVLPGHMVDFIKMDIEGSEIQALRGAARLIKASRPVLAISLYHRPEDIWAIPLELLALCPNYTFSVRQHCYNSFESVLYAVPNRGSGTLGAAK